jgi:hypothetical protein
MSLSKGSGTFLRKRKFSDGSITRRGRSSTLTSRFASLQSDIIVEEEDEMIDEKSNDESGQEEE